MWTPMGYMRIYKLQLPLFIMYLPHAGWSNVSRITSNRKYCSVSILFMCMYQIVFSVLRTVDGNLFSGLDIQGLC